MKILKELELRQEILLDQREKFALFNSFYADTYISEIDSILFWVAAQIDKVKRNKLYYLDNANSCKEDLENIDLYINQYSKLLD